MVNNFHKCFLPPVCFLKTGVTAFAMLAKEKTREEQAPPLPRMKDIKRREERRLFMLFFMIREIMYIQTKRIPSKRTGGGRGGACSSRLSS